MEALLAITNIDGRKQIAYNEKHGITPRSVQRAVQESLHTILKGRQIEESVVREAGGDFNISEVLRELEQEMVIAAGNLEYERAALLRDQIMELKTGTGIDKLEPKRKPVKYGKPARRPKARA
jgi:excinuclease ABC subunit B